MKWKKVKLSRKKAYDVEDSSGYSEPEKRQHAFHVGTSSSNGIVYVDLKVEDRPAFCVGHCIARLFCETKMLISRAETLA